MKTKQTLPPWIVPGDPSPAGPVVESETYSFQPGDVDLIHHVPLPGDLPPGWYTITPIPQSLPESSPAGRSSRCK